MWLIFLIYIQKTFLRHFVECWIKLNTNLTGFIYGGNWKTVHSAQFSAFLWSHSSSSFKEAGIHQSIRFSINICISLYLIYPLKVLSETQDLYRQYPAMTRLTIQRKFNHKELRTCQKFDKISYDLLDLFSLNSI